MSVPVIADKSPIEPTLEPGEYGWCACKQSANAPLCDGAHALLD